MWLSEFEHVVIFSWSFNEYNYTKNSIIVANNWKKIKTNDLITYQDLQ